MIYSQPGCYADTRTFSIGYRINDLASAIGTVTPCEELGIRCLSANSVNENSPLLEPNRRSAPASFEKFRMRLLSDGKNDEVD
jgi:hypothetical protein